jgi:carbon monoxide dehydrogenase subunit G
MPKLHRAIKVSASPQLAWSVLGDLAGVDRWIPGITDVKVRGMEWVCTFANGAVQHEKISSYSGKSRSYSYEIEGSPLQVRNNHGRFAVQAAGDGSVIVWDHKFELLDPSMEEQVTQVWQGASAQIAESLRRLIEGK